MRKKSSYFKIILRSYALAVLLPVLTMGLLLYDMGVVEAINTEKANRKANLSAIAEMLNQRMDECADMALMMSMDEKLLTIAPEISVNTAIDLINRLASYISSRSFFKEVIIKANNSELLYTSEGTVFQRILLTQSYGFSQNETILFEQLLAQNQKGIFFFPDSQTIMNFVPFPLLSATKSGYAIYVINNESLIRILKLGLDEPDCALILYDKKDGQVLFEHNGLGFVVTPAMLAGVKENQIKISGKECVVVTTPIHNSNWVLAWVRQNSAFAADMNLNIVILVLLAVLLISSFLIVYLARRQYAPIQNLSTQTFIDVGNELDNIYQAIISYRETQQTVQQKQRMLRASLILRLLNGEPISNEDMSDMCAALNLFADCHTVQVLAVRFCTALNQQRIIECLEMIEQKFSEVGTAYAVALNHEHELALVCHADSVSQMQDTLYVLEKEMERIAKQKPLLGVGSPCGLTQLAKGLLEARTALEAARPESPDNIVFYEFTRTSPQLNQSFRHFEHQLTYYLRQGNSEAAALTQEKLLNLFRERHTPRQVRRYYQFRIVENIVRIVTDDSVFHELHESEFEQLSPLLTSTLVYTTDEDFQDCVKEIISRVCTIVQRVEALNEERSTQEICQWMMDNISDPNLSLDTLSSALGYSNAYWSRYFKEKLSVSFNDYVWQKRLKRCKELLIETDLSVRDIVTQIGYIDASSFIRRFRKQEGCTPGQFRANHSSVPENEQSS